jgi:hypothetical protein
VTTSEIQQVDLVTRDLGQGADQVVAVMVGGQRLELPLDSQVQVDHEAGGVGAQVHVVLLAGRVRYVDDPEAGA